MPFITQGKANVKYLATVVILLTIIIGSAIYIWSKFDIIAGPQKIVPTTRGYMDQIKTSAVVYYIDNKSYIGFEKSNDYIVLCNKIFSDYKASCSPQINEEEFCVKTKITNTNGYWCVDSVGDSMMTTDQYCTFEKPYCNPERDGYQQK